MKSKSKAFPIGFFEFCWEALTPIAIFVSSAMMMVVLYKLFVLIDNQ